MMNAVEAASFLFLFQTNNILCANSSFIEVKIKIFFAL